MTEAIVSIERLADRTDDDRRELAEWLRGVADIVAADECSFSPGATAEFKLRLDNGERNTIATGV